MKIKNIGIVGFGLIGGSMGLGIKKYTSHNVYAFDNSEETLNYIRENNLCDGCFFPDDKMLSCCDIVFIGLYPKNTVEFINSNKLRFKKDAIICDLCGVKDYISKNVDKSIRFIGAHPMAGTQFSGFNSSRGNLFKNATMIVTPKENTDIRILEKLRNVLNDAGFGAINVFTNAIENTNTGKLLSTDAGLVSGRMYSARNNDERREIAIRDIGSIYFYMWAQNHVGNLLNFAESGRFSRLNPSTANILDEQLAKFLESKGGEMTVEEFKNAVLGKNPAEIKLPESINNKLETEELGRITKFMNKFRNKPVEPLQAVEISKLKEVKELQSVWTRIEEMSKLQPLRQGKAVITKQQIIDAINVAEINNPEFLDNVFNEFTGGNLDKNTGKYVGGASKNEYKYVSNKKLYNLKADMENYVKDLCKGAKDGKVTKDTLKKMKNKNLVYSGINFVAGFAVAALFLSTLIPKFQYWVTRQKTGKDEFPGMYELDSQLQKK